MMMFLRSSQIAARCGNAARVIMVYPALPLGDAERYEYEQLTYEDCP